MLFWNSPGHLLHKTTPELCYFDLCYVFWGHNDSVGRGTTVIYIAAKEYKQHLPRKKMDFYKKNVCNINLMNSYTFLLLSLSLTLDRLDEVTVAWTKRLGICTSNDAHLIARHQNVLGIYLLELGRPHSN